MRKGLLIVLLALLTVSGAALAQDTPPVFCGDLSAADCAILEQSQTAMLGLTAASTEFSLDLQIEAEGNTVPISLTGSATFSGVERMDHELDLGDMTEMPDITPMLDALRGFNADLNLTLTVPEDVAEDMPANTVTLELRLVDGVGYINFDQLQAFMEDAELTGWGGLDIASLIEALAKEITPEMLSQFGDLAEMSNVDPAMMEQMQQFSDPAFIGQYVSITRTDDGSGATATFATTLDFAGMMKDPAMQDMIREQMRAQAEQQGEQMTESEETMALGMVGMVFEDTNMIVTEEIDTATGLVASVSFSMDMDMSNLAEMDDNSSGPVVFTMDAAVTYSYDDIATIAAPEDANMLPYEMLIGMLIGMNMQQQS